jgi:2'-5' RNA ligase
VIERGDTTPRVRTFIAVELPERIRTRLASLQAELSAHAALLKIVNPRLMHLTVRFLGPVPAGRLEAVERACSGACAGLQRFGLSLAGVGSFPERASVPRVIWVGLERDVGYASLGVLFDRLESRLESAGFERERRAFTAHLTLARLRDGASRDDACPLADTLRALKQREFVRDSFEVDALTIMRSDPSPLGPRYTPLARIPLGEGATP